MAPGMRAVIAAMVSLTVAQAPAACADCSDHRDFPDIDALPAVNPADYAHIGTHPSTSAYLFTTPAGVTCMVGKITEMGVQCSGPPVGAAPKSTVMASTLAPAEFSDRVLTLDGEVKVLPVAMKLDAGNGTVCAVVDADTLACRTGPNAGMAPDDPVPHGVHGFVIGPSGNQTF